MFRLQLSPVTFGLIDGLQQGGAALAALLSGVFTDRWRRHREIAGAGYLVSAFCRLGLLLAGRSAAGLIAVTSLDRLGKGLRTSPRDALISLSSPPAGLAAAFGVHRALDTAGAMLGPIVAFALLRWIPGGYDVVFVVSFAVALIGVGILVAFVHNPRAELHAGDGCARRNVGAFLGDSRFRIIAISGAALGLVTLSDSFIYLALQRRLQFGEAYLPLLFVATPAVYMLLAVPAGWLADRVGRAPIIIAGYAALLAAYGILLLPSQGTVALALCIILLGAYYAATNGVMMALASAVLPASLRATGLSIVSTANNAGRILAGRDLRLALESIRGRIGRQYFRRRTAGHAGRGGRRALEAQKPCRSRLMIVERREEV